MAGISSFANADLMTYALAQRLAGESSEATLKPALAEIEDALVPAFIIEELDGCLTVFVPSVPFGRGCVYS